MKNMSEIGSKNRLIRLMIKQRYNKEYCGMDENKMEIYINTKIRELDSRTGTSHA